MLAPDRAGKYQHSAIPDPIPDPTSTVIAGSAEPLQHAELSPPSKMPCALDFLEKRRKERGHEAQNG
jgi:hypothetical protein